MHNRYTLLPIATVLKLVCCSLHQSSECCGSPLLKETHQIQTRQPPPSIDPWLPRSLITTHDDCCRLMRQPCLAASSIGLFRPCAHRLRRKPRLPRRDQQKVLGHLVRDATGRSLLCLHEYCCGGGGKSTGVCPDVRHSSGGGVVWVTFGVIEAGGRMLQNESFGLGLASASLLLRVSMQY